MRNNVLLILAVLIVSGTALADSLNHGRSLEGLDRVKAVFDVNQGDPDVLVLRMSLIEKSAKQLLEAGKKIDFAVVFRGRASRYITLGDKYVDPWELEYKTTMRQWIETFHAAGFTIEQCGIAAQSQSIPAADFPPQIRVVPNGYISLIGYQNQGYGLVPME
ncbi:MAG: DsrE family protein [Pseudomonadota bacterium]